MLMPPHQEAAGVRFLCAASPAWCRDQARLAAHGDLGRRKVPPGAHQGRLLCGHKWLSEGDAFEAQALPPLCAFGRESSPQGNEMLLPTGAVPRPGGHHWPPSGTTRHCPGLTMSSQASPGPTTSPGLTRSLQLLPGTPRPHQVLSGFTR